MKKQNKSKPQELSQFFRENPYQPMNHKAWEKLLRKWYKTYKHEPYWIDNWNNQLDRPTRITATDKNGNNVARATNVKTNRLRKTWELSDYCKYCTDFLIERPEPIVNWKERIGITTDPCVKCGIRDTLQEEREEETFIEIFRETEKISIQGMNEQ
jgi:Tfp pilus assembly major pilin PilA